MAVQRGSASGYSLVVLREDYGVYVEPKNTWIPGDTNIRADALSRGLPLEPVAGVMLSRTSTDPVVVEAMELCNPLSTLDSAVAMCTKWRQLREWCALHLGPPSGPDFVMDVLAPNPRLTL
jgi:hypothetical protein